MRQPQQEITTARRFSPDQFDCPLPREARAELLGLKRVRISPFETTGTAANAFLAQFCAFLGHSSSAHAVRLSLYRGNCCAPLPADESTRGYAAATSGYAARSCSACDI